MHASGFGCGTTGVTACIRATIWPVSLEVIEPALGIEPNDDIFGAMRLAHPKSYYAYWFYGRNLRKYWRAIERFGLIEEYATMISGDTKLSSEFEFS